MNAHDEYAATAGFHLENPNGSEVVVLLHGLGADHRQPLDLVAGLDFSDVAVLAPDVRAHGLSKVIGERSDFLFDELVADLVALMQRLAQSEKPVHLVGISMGAAIALRASLASTLDVKSLALIRPAFSDVPLPSNLRVMSRIGDLLREREPSEARRLFIGTEDYRSVAEITQIGAASLLSQFDAPLATERAVRLRSVPRNVAYADRAELGRVPVPALVIGTENDPVHPLPLAYNWRYGIPEGTFAVVPPRDSDPLATARHTRRLVHSHLLGQKTASWR